MYLSLMLAYPAESGSSSLTNFELSSPPYQRIADNALSDQEEVFSAMQEKQILLEATIRSLTESLVQAQLNAETSRREAADLAFKLETLGIPSTDKSQPGSDQKLLAAMWTLRDMKKQADEARLELMHLMEAVSTLIKTADQVDPMHRLALETEFRKTRELLGETHDKISLNKTSVPVPISFIHALVLEVKHDLSLVIANIGRKQGVQIGMTFKVFRMQKFIGTVRVVDARASICGAVIQNLSSIKNPIREGDYLRVETQK